MRTTPETQRSALPESGSGEAWPNGSGGMASPDDLDVRDYLQILYRRRWIIITMLVLGLLGGMVQNWRTAPLFAASATVQVWAEPNVLGIDRPLSATVEWTREFLPTQLEILSSREIARLAHDELARLAGGKKQVPTVRDIAEGRTVSVVKDTRLISVGFVSRDPALAADVANALARAYVQLNQDSRVSTLTAASAWLAQQVAEQRKLVQASEAALQRYRETHGAEALFTGEGRTEQDQNIVVQQLAQLQGAVTKARTETIEKEAQYRQLSAIQGNHEALDTLPAIAANSHIQGLKAELNTLQRQLVQASKELGERHPDMIKLQGSVLNEERKLQAEISNVVHGIRNDLEAARSRENALMAALQRQKAAVQALNAKSVEYTALERESASNREVLDKLLQRSRETALGSELQSSSVRIVDLAEVPAWPFLPRIKRTVMLGIVGGGAFALALVFLLEIFNTRVTTPQDVRRHLRISMLGMVPRVKPQDGQPSLLEGDEAPP